MNLQKTVAGFLSLLLIVQPAVAAAAAASASPAASYEGTLTRYLDGRASLGELEEARRSFSDFNRSRAVAHRARPPANVPASPFAAEDLPEVEPSELPGPDGEAEKPGRVKKIGQWIKDIPKRTFRRWAPDGQGFQTAKDAEKWVQDSPVPAYTANAAQREADSDWTRPVKVTAQAEVNRVQAVVERVIGFGGLAALAKALSGDKGSAKVVSQAAQVVKRMTPDQRNRVTQAMAKTGITAHIAKFIGGKPTSALGKVVKDQFGNNMILAVVASSMVAAFLNDGLDLDTLKDRLVALDGISGARTRREDLIGVPLEVMAYYHLDRGASNVFNSLWSKVTSGSGGFAGWIQKVEGALTGFGQKIVKTPPSHLAAKAEQFSRQASSLGLPGVSGATALSFRGMSEAMFKAGTVGMLGIPLINAGWKALLGMREGHYIAGNRGKIFARYDYYTKYFQKTGNKWKDALEERKVELTNHVEEHLKFPMTKFLDYFFRFSGGYLGAVVASTLVAPTGLAGFGLALVVSAIFSEGGVAVGKWIGAKLDTSAGYYRRQKKSNARKIFEQALEQDVDLPEKREALAALMELDHERARLGIRTRTDLAAIQSAGGADAERLAELAQLYRDKKVAYMHSVASLAEARANDYERLLKVSQVNRRIHFVRSFDEVLLTKEDGYVKVTTPDWEGHASPRYDFVTAEGRRGIWDYRTNRIIDVGPVAVGNGNRIIFLDDDGVAVDDGVLLSGNDDPTVADEEGKPVGSVVITSNGIVMEKGPKGEWLVRGYGGEFDIVLRQSSRRFVWDGERYLQLGTEVASEVEAHIAEKATPDAPAQEFSAKLVQSLTEKSRKGISSKGALTEALVDLARLHKSKASSLEARYSMALQK